VAAAHDLVLAVFALLFVLACLSRTISVAFLVSQSDPRGPPLNHHAVSTRELVRRARFSADGRLLVYMILVQAAVQISGPFFTPYMLGELSFSYAESRAVRLRRGHRATVGAVDRVGLAELPPRGASHCGCDLGRI
jgi:hypothetical protein